MDPIVDGALGWFAGGVAANQLDRLIDLALDGPRQPPAWPGGEHGGWAEITVGPLGVAKARTPVILTLQRVGHPRGAAFSMALGDTARVRLPGGGYLGAAMVVDPRRRTAAGPALQGIGWSGVRVADHRLSPFVITARPPTPQLVLGLGLRKPDGTPLFRLPPSAPGGTTGCRAGTVRAGQPCTRPGTPPSRLCAFHRNLVQSGSPVHDHDTGTRIHRTW